ncbi:ACP S-malonyltransferase [Lactobacillus ultunensis]|uniref:Malonyl CoA-acyl carrier protein transacylase n=1 Tax=Lactobacillus ultunensis DSM 16047 TaxID=525365 RepID=C2EKW1_9LACO|nr:ACP S-malonyltransferase [Lactobacillus ultunensis]EEJ72818.1 putative [acyl-carrier-protein] S-malonyltransferase [Lactobacillus ultunensis DSM 16047]KRL83119.1 hypothetical protein FC57_GL000112 [Lactobacillus ultunensis DSM 16047]QQP29185.1 ACP S-malonyltransferase [Lactobacillus ultunensis]
MKFALLFSGQGAQKSGMGLDFLADPLFKETIETASQASGKDLIAIFKNENGELNKTVNVQPALVAYEAGIYRMLMRDLPNLPVAEMVGLSLGEYGAMFASGALDLESTIKLVSDRARYMQADADKVENGMAALMRPDLTKVEATIDHLQEQGKRVYIANYNSPKQLVIAGVKQDVDQAAQQLREDKACLKAISLKVNGAFHTPLFNGARAKMHDRLQKVVFKQNKVPVISNTTAQPFTNDWASIMEKQLAVPTHFGECLQYLLDHEQVDTTLEIGPGHTLSSFAKQVDRKLTRYQIDDLAKYQQFIEAENGFKK